MSSRPRAIAAAVVYGLLGSMLLGCRPVEESRRLDIEPRAGEPKTGAPKAVNEVPADSGPREEDEDEAQKGGEAPRAAQEPEPGEAASQDQDP